LRLNEYNRRARPAIEGTMTSQNAEEKSAQLVARLERLPFSRWHKSFFILAFCGIAFDAVDFALFGAALPPVAHEFGVGPAQSGLPRHCRPHRRLRRCIVLGHAVRLHRPPYRVSGNSRLVCRVHRPGGRVLEYRLARDLSFPVEFRTWRRVPVTLTLASEFSPGRIRGSMAGNIMAAFRWAW
jgi:putative MFS transporter